jgi:hypothetical protein
MRFVQRPSCVVVLLLLHHARAIRAEESGVACRRDGDFRTAFQKILVGSSEEESICTIPISDPSLSDSIDSRIPGLCFRLVSGVASMTGGVMTVSPRLCEYPVWSNVFWIAILVCVCVIGWVLIRVLLHLCVPEHARRPHLLTGDSGPALSSQEQPRLRTWTEASWIPNSRRTTDAESAPATAASWPPATSENTCRILDDEPENEAIGASIAWRTKGLGRRPRPWSPDQLEHHGKLLPGLLIDSGAADDPYYDYSDQQMQELLVDIEYYGPLVNRINYHTWTPPLTWTEASRYLIPRGRLKRSLEREISLSVGGTTAPVATLPTADTTTTDPYAASRLVTIRIADHHHAAGTAAKATTAPGDVVIQLPLMQCHVHVRTPVETGVVELYQRDAPRWEWMEHTFASAADAAQFQMDLLTLQYLGSQIDHMYQAFRILHQGSMAHLGDEPVLHFRRKAQSRDGGRTVAEPEEKKDGTDPATDPGSDLHSHGIAWDDVMRCLGTSFPSIRRRLELLWWKRKVKHSNSSQPKRRGTTTSVDTVVDDGEQADGPGDDPIAGSQLQAGVDDDHTFAVGVEALEDQYRRRRTLLGQVDFFRLFVPRLPATSVPIVESTPERVKQMLGWRKRVSRAAILVQAYTRARSITNLGWQLDPRWTKTKISCRLSYDRNIENHRCDKNRRDEIYEGFVSRDVICKVRGLDDSTAGVSFFGHRFGGCSPNRTTFSGYQAFSLVDTKIVRMPTDSDAALNIRDDPVTIFPSLRTIIEQNQDVDFLVACVYHSKHDTADVSLFARTLPREIDTKFDTAVSKTSGVPRPVGSSFAHFMLLHCFSWTGTFNRAKKSGIRS